MRFEFATATRILFGAGTVQWSWGLDSNHDRGSAAADVRMQQATVNLLADMGVQPGSLRTGLVPATAAVAAWTGESSHGPNRPLRSSRSDGLI